MLKQGPNPDEARAKAIEPLKDSGKGSKRTRFSDSTPEMAGKRKKSAKEVTPPGGSKNPQEVTTSSLDVNFSQALQSAKVGITYQRYPEVILITEEMKAIQDAILQEREEAERVSPTHKMGGSLKGSKGIRVACRPLDLPHGPKPQRSRDMASYAFLQRRHNTFGKATITPTEIRDSNPRDTLRSLNKARAHKLQKNH